MVKPLQRYRRGAIAVFDQFFARFQPSRRRRHNQLRLAQAGLPVAVERLAAISAALEQEFLATCESLQELNQAGNVFLQSSDRLIAIAVGRSDGKEFILNSIKILESPLRFLEASLAESERLLLRLREDQQHIQQLAQIETNLRRTMAPLRFVQLLFKVESAPLGLDAQVMFSALTQEIERLHTQVCALFDTKFREMEQVRDTLNGADFQLDSQTAALRKFVTAEKVQIEASLQNLAKELEANQQRDSNIRLLSQKIAGEIQGVVMGLQFQDIINQKMQHVGEALAQILERVGPDPEDLHFLEQSCRLQAGQLQAVRSDLAQAESSVRSGVENFLAHLSKADIGCLSLAEFQQITTSTDGMFQVLLDLISSVRKHVAEAARQTGDGHQQLLPIRRLASGLTSEVLEISQRIHLIGLNAQVQAAQFRHGAGLEVLAARTSEISSETNRISETIATHLDEVARNLAASVETSKQLDLQAIAQEADLSRQGAEAEKSLHALRDEALQIFHDISDLLTRIQSQAREALAQIHYVNTADAALAELQHQLTALAEAAHAQIVGRPKPGASLVNRFRSRYTMASERQVFDRVQAQTGVKSSETTAPPAANGSESDPIGAEGALAGLPEAGPAPAAVTLELDPEPAATSSATTETGIPPAPVKGQDLGDNVELF